MHDSIMNHWGPSWAHYGPAYRCHAVHLVAAAQDETSLRVIHSVPAQQTTTRTAFKTCRMYGNWNEHWLDGQTGPPGMCMCVLAVCMHTISTDGRVQKCKNKCAGVCDGARCRKPTANLLLLIALSNPWRMYAVQWSYATVAQVAATFSKFVLEGFAVTFRWVFLKTFFFKCQRYRLNPEEVRCESTTPDETQKPIKVKCQENKGLRVALRNCGNLLNDLWPAAAEGRNESTRAAEQYQRTDGGKAPLDDEIA